MRRRLERRGEFLAGQLAPLAPATESTGGVACWAHVGGFAAGALLVLLFRNPQLLEKHPYHGWNRGSPTRSWHKTRR